MWRLLNDLIATPLNLLNHHVPIFGRCDGCRKDWGSSIHVLYLCEDTKHIWKGSIFWEFMKRSRFKSMGELGYELRKNCSKTDYELWVLTSYFAWQFVCKKKHDSNAHVYKVSLDSSRSYLNEFQKARKSLHTSCGLGVQVGERVWKPPPSGIFRLDVDAAVNEENQRFGYGAVIRDWNGRICAAMAMPATSPGSIVEAEVQAMFHGLELCCHEKCVPIDVYSDSLLAVKLLTSEKNEIEFMGSKSNLLVRAFEDGVIKHFYHMFRSANILAHSLAQFGARCDKMYTWNSSFPPWLRRLVE